MHQKSSRSSGRRSSLSTRKSSGTCDARAKKSSQPSGLGRSTTASPCRSMSTSRPGKRTRPEGAPLAATVHEELRRLRHLATSTICTSDIYHGVRRPCQQDDAFAIARKGAYARAFTIGGSTCRAMSRQIRTPEPYVTEHRPGARCAPPGRCSSKDPPTSSCSSCPSSCSSCPSSCPSSCSPLAPRSVAGTRSWDRPTHPRRTLHATSSRSRNSHPGRRTSCMRNGVAQAAVHSWSTTVHLRVLPGVPVPAMHTHGVRRFAATTLACEHCRG